MKKEGTEVWIEYTVMRVTRLSEEVALKNAV